MGGIPLNAVPLLSKGITVSTFVPYAPYGRTCLLVVREQGTERASVPERAKCTLEGEVAMLEVIL
jgi:hypothetical protein